MPPSLFCCNRLWSLTLGLFPPAGMLLGCVASSDLENTWRSGGKNMGREQPFSPGEQILVVWWSILIVAGPQVPPEGWQPELGSRASFPPHSPKALRCLCAPPGIPPYFPWSFPNLCCCDVSGKIATKFWVETLVEIWAWKLGGGGETPARNIATEFTLQSS